MINSSNNAEFTLNYFIENIQGLVKFIDKLDIQVIGGKCELLVYLTSMDKFVRWLFSKEKNFSRFILKDGICAVFSAPKKYNDTIYIIYKCGIKGCTKETLYGLKTENPWLQKVTRDSLFYIFILRSLCLKKFYNIFYILIYILKLTNFLHFHHLHYHFHYLLQIPRQFL